MVEAIDPQETAAAAGSGANEGQIPSRYTFSRLSLTPAGTKPLIRKVLAGAEPLDRAEICRLIEPLHIAQGGRPTPRLEQAVKKAPQDLRASGDI